MTNNVHHIWCSLLRVFLILPATISLSGMRPVKIIDQSGLTRVYMFDVQIFYFFEITD